MQKSTAIEVSEGAGARVRRAFPQPEIRHVDPFVLLDEFFVEPPAGFPEHPHRGFEIVTYMIEGAFEHTDNLGNRHVVTAGGLQRITAGAGIRHSEMPGPDLMNHGLQLWVNLPAGLKGINPAYQTVDSDKIPVQHQGKAKVRILVGEGSTTKLFTRVLYYVVSLHEGEKWQVSIPEEYTSVLIYVLRGDAVVNKSSLHAKPGDFLIFRAEPHLEISSAAPLDFAFIAGAPHNEPIRQYGPFVD